MKSRIAAALICWFLGGFGGHKFYLGNIGWGITYLLFFWTGIPFIAAFVEFIILIFTSDDEFNAKFNGVTERRSGAVSAKDATGALQDLKQLYDQGIITAEEYEEKRKSLLRNL